MNTRTSAPCRLEASRSSSELPAPDMLAARCGLIPQELSAGAPALQGTPLLSGNPKHRAVGGLRTGTAGQGSGPPLSRLPLPAFLYRQWLLLGGPAVSIAARRPPQNSSQHLVNIVRAD